MQHNALCKVVNIRFADGTGWRYGK